MIRRIVIALLVLALGAAILFGIVHGYEAWRAHVYAEGDTAGAARVQQAWNKDKIARDEAQAVAVATARKDEQAQAAAAIQGEKDARDLADARAAEADRAARGAAAAAGGMRDTIATLDSAARQLGVPSAAACPGLFAGQRDEAIRARSALAACSDGHQQLARDADSALNASELRGDTALSYIKATGAPGADQIQLPAPVPSEPSK